MAYWRGSVWKLVYREIIVWFIAYFTLFLIFQFGIKNSAAEQPFRDVVEFCKMNHPKSELLLMLGWFTAAAIARFWAIYQTLWWPDNVALTLATYLKSNASFWTKKCLWFHHNFDNFFGYF